MELRFYRLWSKKVIKEFPNKGWGLRGLKAEKAARNWHDGKTK